MSLRDFLKQSARYTGLTTKLGVDAIESFAEHTTNSKKARITVGNRVETLIRKLHSRTHELK
jgi:hypothetical protein